MHKLNLQIVNEDFMDIFHAIDEDHNGTISYLELLKFSGFQENTPRAAELAKVRLRPLLGCGHCSLGCSPLLARLRPLLARLQPLLARLRLRLPRCSTSVRVLCDLSAGQRQCV